jgi:hypothetical protein
MSNHDPGASERDWRWIIVLAVVCYGALIAIGSLCGGREASQKLLQVLGVPALDHPFMDIRGVAGWCESFAAGKDPLVETTYISIPGEKPILDYRMNYSPLVLMFRFLGLNQRYAPAWASLLALLYAASLLCLCGRCTLQQAFLWGILILSPLSVMVVERGNLDMLLFALLIAALLLRKYPYVASAAILVAGLIKFFPIGALSAVWRAEGKKNRVTVLLCTIMFLIFILFLRSRLGLIGGSLTGQYQSAFGCGVVADLLEHYGILASGNYGVSRGALVLLAVTLLSITSVCGFRSKKAPLRHVNSERLQYAFFLTAPFMLGLFVLGNQMDYKWIFFLPMVPLMLELLESPLAVESRVSKIWLVGVLTYSYWTFFSDEGSLRNALLKQVVMWGVMLLSAFLLGRLCRKKGA